MVSSPQIVLALDVGTKRIGVARGIFAAKLASPLVTLDQTNSFIEDITSLIKREQADVLVIGRPLNSSGESTDQTRYTVNFIADLKQQIDIPIVWQDETLTSVKAEQELVQRGKAYTKADIDALAATYILEDYFTTTDRLEV